MKRKHTQAKKARRCSAFCKSRNTEEQSFLRKAHRESLQPVEPKTKGFQVLRVQRVFLKKDRFGAPLYKTILHARLPVQGPATV